MNNPFTGSEAVFVTEKRRAIYRKEAYEYTHLSYQCRDTDEAFTTTPLDTVNMLQVHNQYRMKYDIPFPDEILHTRKQYGLSALKMSHILGFGDNQYRLYENGEIPNVANGRVLRAIQSSTVFESFVEAAKSILSEAEYAKIKHHIEEYRSAEPAEKWMTNLIFGKAERTQYNGYALPSVDRLKNVLLFFIDKFDGVFITQMNKLLFYTDFLSYRDYGQAITGLSFKAIQYGPVPCHWDRVYSLMDGIEQTIVESDHFSGTKLVSEHPCDLSCFSPKELDVLDKIYQTFKHATTASISRKSHEEQAWLKNIDTHSVINFDNAFSLKID